MSKIIGVGNYYLYGIWQQEADRRVEKYPFMNGGPWLTLIMIAAYLYFVKCLGPQLMKDRKPLGLRKFMFGYNIAMVIISGWLFYEGSVMTNFGLDVWGCQSVDYSATSPAALHVIHIGWIYFISKFVEFTDTIIFVLRKKYSQITFLHVIHHSIVPLSVWIGLKYAPGGNNIFFPWLNSFVHTVMYLYYGLSALGPSIQRFLWWKKYITKLQMLQFLLAITHGTRALLMPNCVFPKSFLFLNMFNAFLFLALFYHFYKQSYLKTKSV